MHQVPFLFLERLDFVVGEDQPLAIGRISQFSAEL